MRSMLFAILAIFLSVPVISAPVAWYVPGKSGGISVIQCPDGLYDECNVDGKKAIKSKTSAIDPSAYIYCKLSSEIKAKLNSTVYLMVYYYDEGLKKVAIEYNSTTKAYQQGPSFLLIGDRSWQRAMLPLTNINFTGRQNGASDFRLVASGGITISKIELYIKKPDVVIPSVKERFVKKIKVAPQPKDMYYTFGNDADEMTAAIYKSLGVTSIESYVTWENCERKGEGQWDWSQWDKQVKILKDNGLKWVPFVIVGPAYSTPNWFRAGKEHFPCRCLEHGIDSKIESLWNPNLPKWVDRFLGEFAKRYKDSGVIESVLLGIQGDYGEAIFSVSGGGWTFDIPGEYHNHQGFWCDDPYALDSYRKFVEKRYGTVEAANKAWGTTYTAISDVDFPARGEEAINAVIQKAQGGDAFSRRRYLDFVDWYRESMTNLSDWWIATAQKYFPNTPIYLCTGGDAIPQHGSNFAEQCRVAAKYKGGVRITNEGSDYVSNFLITRWVASAGKHYNSYFGFEPAGPEDEKGIVARIYNATASGANQLHDYNPNVVSSESRIEAQRKHLKYLFHVSKPVVPVALWYPNVSLTINWGGFFDKAAYLRRFTDLDYLDESMLHSGALDAHKILVIMRGEIMETEDARLIAKWVENGGRVIVFGVPRFESVEGKPEPEQILFGDNPKGCELGKGRIERFDDMKSVPDEIRRVLGELEQPVFKADKDGVFSTQISANTMFVLNTSSENANIEVAYKGNVITSTAPAGTICEVKF